MAETVAAEKWLYSVLAADATLTGAVSTRIYAYTAPESATFPLVLFGQQSATDLMGVGPYRIWANMLYVVRGVGETASMAGVQTIANRIDTVLHAASGSNVDGIVYACVRVQPFALSETISGRQFRHLGGIYRLFVK